MSNILIAGHKGFIGNHVCDELDYLEERYHGIDLKDGSDICDTDGSLYDIIVLLAADLGRDKDMYCNNLRIYSWAAKQKAHIVYASSAAVYADGVVGMERTIPDPPTLYGESKLLGETILKATHDSWTILRLANVYGHGDGNGAIDAFQRGATTIYGDGSDVRDYVSVHTVAEAFVKAALNPEKYRNEIYNISTGEATTTLEAFKQYGSGEPTYLDPRPYDTKYSVLTNVKAVDAGLICK